ncbi:MAG: hypothetical protein WDN29_06440 [Methylovirgula sp.]
MLSASITGFLTRVSAAPTNALEQVLIDKTRAQKPSTSVVMNDGAGAMMLSAHHHSSAATALPVEGDMPSLAGATQWLNSPPLTREGLRGKVVLVDFWTYSCINCLRALPYVARLG